VALGIALAIIDFFGTARHGTYTSNDFAGGPNCIDTFLCLGKGYGSQFNLPRRLVGIVQFRSIAIPVFLCLRHRSTGYRRLELERVIFLFLYLLMIFLRSGLCIFIEMRFKYCAVKDAQMLRGLCFPWF
jgi:hypothetical protein